MKQNSLHPPLSPAQLTKNLLVVIFGSASFALGFNLFLDPYGFNCGGISGIAMLVVHAVDHPGLTVGLLSMLINIPLFLLGWRHIGRYFFFTSLLGMTVGSVCLDLFAALPVPATEPVVAAIFGGVICGSGIGVVFLVGASTGGVDIVARLLKLKLRNFPIGKIILLMDLCTAVATGVVYGAFNNTLYSIITLVLSSVFLDKVVYGLEYAKVALIISDKHEQIAQQIGSQLSRGCTLLRGQGYFQRQDKSIILSAVKRKQLAQIKELVMTIDPAAFLILLDAHQVLGDGFRRYDRNEI